MLSSRGSENSREATWLWHVVLVVWCLLFMLAAGAALAFSVAAFGLVTRLVSKEPPRDARQGLASPAESETPTRSPGGLGRDLFQRPGQMVGDVSLGPHGDSG